MKMKKENRGITLIALIITIIVLLILAGVTISLTLGDEGIFKVAEKSAEETKKAQIKEELETAIVEIQSKKIAEGKEFKREDLKQLESIGATIQKTEVPTLGNYKNYEFTIDENYKVEIGNSLSGRKVSIEIKNIKDISFTIEASINYSNDMVKEYRYYVNGKEVQKETKDKTYKVTKIDESTIIAPNTKYKVQVKAYLTTGTIMQSEEKEIITRELMSHVTIKKPESYNALTQRSGTNFTIQIEPKYEDSDIQEYVYYVDNEVVKSNTTAKQYQVAGLERWKKFEVKVEIKLKNGIIEEITEIADTYDNETILEYKPLVNRMSSNTSNQGEVIYDSTYSNGGEPRYPWPAFNNGIYSNYWDPKSGAKSCYLGFKFNEAKTVKWAYAAIFCNDKIKINSKLEGSNDGTNWNELSNEIEVDLTTGARYRDVYFEATKNIGSYNYYRIYMNSESYINLTMSHEGGILSLQFFE